MIQVAHAVTTASYQKNIPCGISFSIIVIHRELLFVLYVSVEPLFSYNPAHQACQCTNRIT